MAAMRVPATPPRARPPAATASAAGVSVATVRVATVEWPPEVTAARSSRHLHLLRAAAPASASSRFRSSADPDPLPVRDRGLPQGRPTHETPGRPCGSPYARDGACGVHSSENARASSHRENGALDGLSPSMMITPSRHEHAVSKLPSGGIDHSCGNRPAADDGASGTVPRSRGARSARQTA